MKEQERAQFILDGKPRNWRTLHYVLYTSLALISTRLIFRLIEFASGLDPSTNLIPYHEAYFMRLDTLPITHCDCADELCASWTCIARSGSEFPKGPTRKGKKAAKKEKRALKEKRKIKLKSDSTTDMA